MRKQILSVITPTLNNQNDINFFLNSLEKQIKKNYKLEIVISDGGSRDGTKKIAKKFNCKIINNPDVLADPGVNAGILAAHGDILIILAIDNIFKDKFALEKILQVFKNHEIAAAFPKHCSIKSDSVFTKYINTFTDPFSHFVYGYGANGRTFKKKYKTKISNELYEVYDFSTNKDKPLIAFAQGFAIRRGFFRKKKDSFDDVSPVIDLINNKNKIAFVHSVNLYHHTVRNLNHFINKQMWATINALQKKNYGIAHRMTYLSNSQRNRIKIWPIYSLTILPPFFYAGYHIVKDREKMWIFHPFLCIISGYSSVFGTLKFLFNKNAQYKRK